MSNTEAAIIGDREFTEFAQREYRNDAYFTAYDLQIAYRAWSGARAALAKPESTTPAAVQAGAVSDLTILHLWDTHVGYASGDKHSLTTDDKLAFARAVQAHREETHP
jgi:hypothetical protein